MNTENIDKDHSGISEEEIQQIKEENSKEFKKKLAQLLEDYSACLVSHNGFLQITMSQKCTGGNIWQYADQFTIGKRFGMYQQED